MKTAFEQGAISTDAAYEFSRTDKKTQEKTLCKIADEPSKTAKAVHTVIRQAQEEKPKSNNESRASQSSETIPTNKGIIARLYKIKAKLEKMKLSDKQVFELKSRLFAIEEYLDQIKTV